MKDYRQRILFTFILVIMLCSCSEQKYAMVELIYFDGSKEIIVVPFRLNQSVLKAGCYYYDLNRNSVRCGVRSYDRMGMLFTKTDIPNDYPVFY